MKIKHEYADDKSPILMNHFYFSVKNHCQITVKSLYSFFCKKLLGEYDGKTLFNFK